MKKGKKDKDMGRIRKVRGVKGRGREGKERKGKGMLRIWMGRERKVKVRYGEDERKTRRGRNERKNSAVSQAQRTIPNNTESSRSQTVLPYLYTLAIRELVVASRHGASDVVRPSERFSASCLPSVPDATNATRLGGQMR